MPERIETKMKQLISDGVLAIELEQSSQTTQSCLAFPRLYADTKLLSDESKVLILTYLYLELRLNAEQALRAARADIMKAPRASSHK
jgi:hypothetical protein